MTPSSKRAPVSGRKVPLQFPRNWSSGIPPSQAKEFAKPGFNEQGQDLDRLLREVVDTCASNVAVLDESGVILYASKAWRRFERTNSPRSRQHSKLPNPFGNYTRFTGSSTARKANATLSEDIQEILLGDEEEFHRKYWYNGVAEPRQFVTHATRLDLPGLAFRVLVAYDDDVFAKEAPRRTEDTISQLLETTKILVWEAEPRTWQFTHVGKQAVEMLGYRIAEWYEPDFLASHIHRDDKQRVLSFFQTHSPVDGHPDMTFRMLASDGQVVWVKNLVSITYESGKPAKMAGFMIDISERKRAEETRREFGGRLIAAQEEERARIARELHDDLNQRMALMSIELEQVAAASGKSLRGRLRKIQEQAQEISADIHRISYRLHPSKLDHLGLVAAVKSLCKELSERQNLRIELKETGFPAAVTKDVRLCAFRIVQEALRNCVKYSDAQTVHVLLEKTDDAIRLSVSDDGCGFDMESAAMKKGLGFISMRERVHLVGGEIQIHSQPRRGTRIKVSIPVLPNSDPVDSLT